MPLFSLIVPIYKVEEYLKECIESILRQTFQDYEIILVDDGSPDGCPSICDFYASQKTNIKVVHKINEGIVSARQAGLNVSMGQYIVNVDGDDCIEPQLLENLYAIVKQYEPDIISYNFRKVSEEGKLIGKGKNKLPVGLYQDNELVEVCRKLLYDTDENDLNKNTGNVIYSVWSKAIKRDILMEFGSQIPLNIKNGEDIAVTIPAMCKCKSLYILDEEGYNYRIRDNSMVNSFREGEMEQMTELLCFLEKAAYRVPKQNIIGYGLCRIDIHVIAAARNIKSYRDFKEYVLKTLDSDLMGIIHEFDYRNLQMKYKLRVFALKYKLVGTFWLMYHKK